MSKIKLVDKRSKAEKKADAARSRNGSWSAFRPAVMRSKTKYARKGNGRRVVIMVATAIATNSGRMTVWGNVLMAATMLIAIINVGIVIVAGIAARRKKS